MMGNVGQGGIQPFKKHKGFFANIQLRHDSADSCLLNLPSKPVIICWRRLFWFKGAFLHEIPGSTGVYPWRWWFGSVNCEICRFGLNKSLAYIFGRPRHRTCAVRVWWQFSETKDTVRVKELTSSVSCVWQLCQTDSSGLGGGGVCSACIRSPSRPLNRSQKVVCVVFDWAL